MVRSFGLPKLLAFIDAHENQNPHGRGRYQSRYRRFR